MVYTYKTKGTCSREITVDVRCQRRHSELRPSRVAAPGNLDGISKLIVGMKAEDVIDRVRGTRCGLQGHLLPPISSPMRWKRLLRAAK